MHTRLSLFSIILAAAILLAPAMAFSDVVLDAMSAELARAKTLKASDFDPPYFVSYAVYDFIDWGAEADFGGLLSDYENNSRRGWVEVRVGDYAFDNSGKSGLLNSWDPDLDFDRAHMNLRLPTEDDPDALRVPLWLVTDTMYKAAVADYLRKKGKSAYMIDRDQGVADFSRETPVVSTEPLPDWKDVDKKPWAKLVEKASAIFKEYPSFTQGNVSVSFSVKARRFVSTEGAKIIDGERYFVLRIVAENQAEDGQKLSNFANFHARTIDKLPNEEDVLAKVREVADTLVALSKAEKFDPYTGPAILDPSLAGVFFHEAVGHRLEGERQADSDEGQTFKGKIGEKILPEFLSLIDDPTTKDIHGSDLFGHYRFDDEGVPAQSVDLIKDGVLKNFLLSRTPIDGFTNSNGHGRSDGTQNPRARMGNTIVVSQKTVPADKMKKMLLKLARKQGKPYALILRQASGGETATSAYNFQAFKHSPVLVYKVDVKTGKETLVRGAEVVGTPLVSLNKVKTAGDDPKVFNGFCGAESGWVPVSVVAPSLLISEIELQRTSDKPVRPPILPQPFAK